MQYGLHKETYIALRHPGHHNRRLPVDFCMHYSSYITGPTAGRTWLFLLRCFVNADEHRGVVMAVNFYAADVLKLQSTQQLCAALGGTCTKRSAADPEAVAVPHSEVAVIFGRAKLRLSENIPEGASLIIIRVHARLVDVGFVGVHADVVLTDVAWAKVDIRHALAKCRKRDGSAVSLHCQIDVSFRRAEIRSSGLIMSALREIECEMLNNLPAHYGGWAR